jgi:hypothetical protein
VFRYWHDLLHFVLFNTEIYTSWYSRCHQSVLPPSFLDYKKSLHVNLFYRHSNLNIKYPGHLSLLPPFSFFWYFGQFNIILMVIFNTCCFISAQVDYPCHRPQLKGGGLSGKFELKTFHFHWGKYKLSRKSTSF